MILRERLPDNYDPEMPWVIEFESASDLVNSFSHHRSAISVIASTIIFKGRKIGFADHQDALMLFLRLK